MKAMARGMTHGVMSEVVSRGVSASFKLAGRHRRGDLGRC